MASLVQTASLTRKPETEQEPSQEPVKNRYTQKEELILNTVSKQE